MAVKNQKTPSIEKSVQTILTFIITGLMAWTGINVADQGRSIAVLTERVHVLQQKVEMLAGKPFFDRMDFEVSIKPLDQRVTIVEKELDKRVVFMAEAESRIRKIESQLILLQNRRASP